jgi:hypothetical protein
MKKKTVKKPAKGSKGSSVQAITTTRRRDAATGHFVKSCSSKPVRETVITRDGTRARITYRCEDSTGEPSTVKVLRVGVDAALRRELKSALKSDPEGAKAYIVSLKELVQEKLNEEFNLERYTRIAGAETRSASAKRGAATKAATAGTRAKKLATDKERAKSEAEAVRAKIGSARASLVRSKSRKTQATLKRRITRLEGARVQLLKIVAGKASKYPSASALR